MVSTGPPYLSLSPLFLLGLQETSAGKLPVQQLLLGLYSATALFRLLVLACKRCCRPSWVPSVVPSQVPEAFPKSCKRCCAYRLPRTINFHVRDPAMLALPSTLVYWRQRPLHLTTGHLGSLSAQNRPAFSIVVPWLSRTLASRMLRPAPRSLTPAQGSQPVQHQASSPHL